MRLIYKYKLGAFLIGSVLALLCTRLAIARDSEPSLPLSTAQSAAAANQKSTKRDIAEGRRVALPESAKAALSASAGDRAVPVLNFKTGPEAGHKWLSEMSTRLQERVPDRKQRTALLRTVHHEAISAGLDPQLVLALIEVQSGFRKYAVSTSGARGYMQVMPFWTAEAGRPGDNLFHLRTNLIYGCWILRHYLDLEKGDTIRALGRYKGGTGAREFSKLVHDAWRTRWAYDGPTS